MPLCLVLIICLRSHPLSWHNLHSNGSCETSKTALQLDGSDFQVIFQAAAPGPRSPNPPSQSRPTQLRFTRVLTTDIVIRSQRPNDGRTANHLVAPLSSIATIPYTTRRFATSNPTVCCLGCEQDLSRTLSKYSNRFVLNFANYPHFSS